MSTQMTTLPASAGADASFGTPLGGRSAAVLGSHIKGWLEAWLTSWREAFALRRTLREIEDLSDRELCDIGLSGGEIHRVRRGEVFWPTGWDARNVGRDQLPM